MRKAIILIFDNVHFMPFEYREQTAILETQEQQHWVKHWNQTQHSLNLIWVVKTKEGRHTKDIHQQFTLFPLFITSTDNNIGDTGTASLSESLKSNTTLTELNLRSEDKRNQTHKRHPSTNHSFPPFHHINRQQYWRHGNSIIEWIIEIKHNTHWTLSKEWGQKREDTRKTSTSNSLFSISLLFNRQQDWRKRSNVIEWITEIKYNTHWTQSELWLEKKEDTWKTTPISNPIFSFLFMSTDNKIGDTGAILLSQSLKSNTTLIKLYLGCEDKRISTKTSINESFFSFPFTSTDSNIGDTGTTSLSEVLKSNTTLTELYIRSKNKRKKTYERYSSTNRFFSFILV